jgi:Mrp family chromosome partitioning ATPase
VQTLTEELLAVENSARTLSIEASSTGIDFVEEARTPEEPLQPKPARNAALGGAVGLVLAAALADLLSRRRRRRRLDPSTVLGAPLLARIPNLSRSGGRTADPLFDIDAAEAYQFLLASFEYAMARTHATSILVTSPSSGDGKSMTALQLARAVAMQGRNVTLVDADIRAGGLTSLLNAEEHPGLVSLANGAALDEVVRLYRISHGVRLRVIHMGQPPQSPTGLLTTDAYREAISTIMASTDLTIIDGGPLLTVADASALAMQVSGILLVLDAETGEDDLLAVQQHLRLIPTPLLGYVVNRSPEVRAAPYASGSGHSRAVRVNRSVAESDGVGHTSGQHQERAIQH